MKKPLLLVIALALLLVPTPLALADSWVEVVRFEGNDTASTVTAPFTCDYPEWRIKWAYDPGHWHFPVLHGFSVTTYPQGETINYVDQIHELANESKIGIHNIHGYSGTFYMKISTGIIENYTITVEQNIAATPTPSPTASAPPSPSTPAPTISTSQSPTLQPTSISPSPSPSQSASSSPSPTIPEFTLVTLLVLAVAMCFAAIIITKKLEFDLSGYWGFLSDQNSRFS
ncbi:MAG: hypothetical protein NWF00_08650 [Candidatus Bathyarchaeota archaeon]|nr:hypothetical protein [Candidatus Bathyarchaeota archaeon]